MKTNNYNNLHVITGSEVPSTNSISIPKEIADSFMTWADQIAANMALCCYALNSEDWNGKISQNALDLLRDQMEDFADNLHCYLE